MSLLSGSLRPRSRRSMAAPALALEARDGAVRFSLAGAVVEALPGGALWIEDARALIVSDLHLEKGSAFGQRGQMLPPYDTAQTLARLEEMAVRLRPDVIVSLGDSFHDQGGPARMGEADVAALARIVARAEFIWIEGNHDPAPPPSLGGRSAAEVTLGGLRLRHEPSLAPGEGEVAGHLHPCARVSGRGRSVRARCFATDGARLVMPAFGAYAGGLNVRDPAFAPVFPRGCVALMLGRAEVHPAGADRLSPDVM